ncbi:MAG TPA: hypothetical protein PKY76_11440, partial [Bacteroidales bacterium]|nr:hypothetical protein [Bacteroidales bacterium]
MLRWSPTTATSWHYLNQYGYMLERYTLYRNGQFIDNPKTTRKELGIIKPWPKEQFEKVIDSSDRLAIVAQALYGESFVVEVQTTSQTLMNRVNELQSRFTFCLFAAGQSILAATASGLFYADSIVNPGEKYVYRIIPLVPDTLERIDTGYVYVGLDDWQPLPRPILLSAQADDRMITLKWDRKHFEQVFLYYIVERSSDGRHFERINEQPYFNISQKQDEEDYYIRLDSLPDYNKRYYYRIRGVNLFEEISPPSDTLSFIAIARLQDRPVITGAYIDRTSVTIKWNFSAQQRNQLKGYQIYRGFSRQTISTPLNRTLLSPFDTSFSDTSPMYSNYYIVKAIDQNGNVSESLPYFVSIEDSIPPNPPAGLRANIDTTGKVILQWTKNQESDILGYQVFRANYPNEDFLQISKDIVTDTLFYDYVGLHSLTPRVYYRIKALDKHYNPSDFSIILSVLKPDLIPPQPPVISEYRVENGIITLHFIPSSSADVRQYVAYRLADQDSLWRVCGVMPVGGKNSFTDTCWQAPCYFTYQILAVDSAGNESIPSEKLKIISNRKYANQETNNINFYAIKNERNNQIDLYWAIPPKATGLGKLYRSINNAPFRLMITLNSQIQHYADNDIKAGQLYRYKILC